MQGVYCPNQNCPLKGKTGNHFIKSGTYRRKESLKPLQRYKCKLCLHRFSQRVFTLNYRNRLDFINKKIFQSVLHGASNCAIARMIGVAESTVRKRINRLSRAGLTWMTPLIEKMPINESIVYDGFESFSESQYYPFNINLCIGKKSHFIYNMNFVPLNRKGKMTEAQKKKRQEIYHTRGKFAGNLTEKASLALFHWCAEKSAQEFHLLTDEHLAYARAIKSLKKMKPSLHIRHDKINSKVKRDVHNILFPVNCFDLHLRQFLACFKRETISFCRTAQAAMAKTVLFTLYKNFMRPIFLKKKDKRVESSISPAMSIGVTQMIYQFDDIFKRVGVQNKHHFQKIHQKDHLFSLKFSST